MPEDKSNINPEGPEKKDVNPINPEKDETPHVGPDHLKIPHIGKKKVRPLNLFETGPNRGGSLGRRDKK